MSLLGQGHDCEVPPSDDESLAITGSMSERDLGSLADLVQMEVERSLVSHVVHKLIQDEKLWVKKWNH